MARLGVNIDHIASLRQLRKGKEPNLTKAARICESAGADSIVIHLREDRRHIQDKDLCMLRKIVSKKLNLEMSIASSIINIACKVKPDQATLVPEKRLEITTEGGLDVVKYKNRIKNAVKRLKKNNIEVSLFIDPDKKQIIASKEAGVDMVELHTGRYANATDKRTIRLKEIIQATNFARDIGLTVNAGHGLDYLNVKPIARISGIEELNIGYSIVCRAAIAGLEKAVKEMINLIK